MVLYATYASLTIFEN